VATAIGASDIVADSVDFHDIAGLVRGAHEGEGLGNQFLANIRETDAIIHVVRAHHDDGIIHPEGSVDPLRDIETIETELVYADLEQVEKRLERVVRTARGGDRAAVVEQGWLEALASCSSAASPRASCRRRPRSTGARASTCSPPSPCSSWQTWTRAPTRSPRRCCAHAEAQGAGAVALSSRLEAELSELDPEDAGTMREELGVGGQSGLQRVVRGAFELLRLNAFFTVGTGKPAQSWHLRRGLTAWHAAGPDPLRHPARVRRAEVIPWDALLSAGSYSAARDKGTLRLEGRDYVMQDGDVITVKFTP
jgi:ribosome-binding ATPase YchF (GTP1/OBG family)